MGLRFGAWVTAAAALCSAVCGAQTVSILNPTGSTGTSPLTVSATVSASVTDLQLYVDGKKFTQSKTTSLSTSVTLSDGTHRLAVQAIEGSKVVSKVVKYVTVSSSAPPTTPDPTPSGTQITDQQESSSWLTCGTCGNSSGNNQQATYSMVRGITSPTVDNTSTSAEFSIGGNYPYANAYWYIKNPALSTPVQSLTYDFYIYVPAATGNSPQAIEFECQQTVNGYVYNYAWQADYPTHTWRTFDYINRAWISTNIPFNGFTTDTWHHITTTNHASGTTGVHDAITVDGLQHTVSIARPAKYTGQSWNALTNAFQLDLNGHATPYSVYVDHMSLTYQ